MFIKDAISLLKATFAEWSEDRATRLAAALAYYTAVALAPLLVILIAVAGLAFGREAAEGQVVAQIGSLVGQQSAQAIQEIIVNASQPSGGIIPGIIAIAALLFGASGVFGELQDGLNTIWEVKPKPGRGIFGMIKDRFFSLTMVLGAGFLLLVSLVLSAALAAMGSFMVGILPLPPIIMQSVNFIVSLVVITLVFAMIFKLLHDADIAWRDVWIGAALTALLFTIGKWAIGLYLGSSNVGNSYGAAGSFVLILIWVYYSAQIFFFGAEFTQVYANKYGSRIKPDEDAVPVTEEERAQQGAPRKERIEEASRERKAS